MSVLTIVTTSAATSGANGGVIIDPLPPSSDKLIDQSANGSFCLPVVDVLLLLTLPFRFSTSGGRTRSPSPCATERHMLSIIIRESGILRSGYLHMLHEFANGFPVQSRAARRVGITSDMVLKLKK
jgi:hypothetical protein